MLALRLQRAQAELQAHRNWLKLFTGSTTIPRPSPWTRSFTSSHGRLQTQKKVYGKPRTAWQKKQKRKQDDAQEVNLKVLSHREQLLQAVRDYDVKQVIVLYGNLPEKKPLTPEDLQAIAQALHHSIRLERYKPAPEKQRELIDDIVSFAVQLVKDIRKERLLPSTHAHVHLLGLFKESGNHDVGLKFWQWLQMQDEEFVTIDVYAVALDLLAVNGTPLEELEQLYEEALARFPGTFSAYHLSPNAVLEDRDQAVRIKDLPTSLLYSITLARLLGGDSRNAYLALDSALRLYPASTNQRFFTIFRDERPISEYFTVFAMACRAGQRLPISHYKQIIATLRRSSDFTSLSEHIAIIRAMLAATYLHIGAVGSVPSNTVNEMTIAITHIMRVPGISSMESKERKKLVDSVFTAVKKMIEVFARYGALPSEAVFNAIITNVGGYGRVKSAIGIATTDMKHLGVETSNITRNATVNAAGLLGDSALIKKTWRSIVDAYREKDQYPSQNDFHNFIRAARLADIGHFAWDEFLSMKDHLPGGSHDAIESQFSHRLESQATKQAASASSSEDISESIEGLNADLAILDVDTKDRPAIQDFNGKSLPMALVPPPKFLQLPEQEIRKLYDELTTEGLTRTTQHSDERTAVEPSQPDESTPFGRQASPPPSSATNVPYGTLRYKNWKALNYLLWLSDKHDQEHKQAVDEAIAAGIQPPKRNTYLAKSDLAGMKAFSLEEVHKTFLREDKDHQSRLEKAREEILRLRGRTSTSTS